MKIIARNTDTLTGIIFFALSLAIIWETRKFATSAEEIRAIGPQVFPYAIAGTMGILSVLVFIKGLRAPADEHLRKKTFFHDFMVASIIAACSFCFIFFVEYIGVVPYMFLFLAILQYVLGERSIKNILLVAIIDTAAMYLIFAVCLKIVFPMGFLEF